MLASVNSCVVDPTYQNIETWAKQVVCVVMSMSMKRSGGDGFLSAFLSALAAKAAATITERIRQDGSGSKTRCRPAEYRGDFFRGFCSGRFNAFCRHLLGLLLRTYLTLDYP